MKKEKKRLDVLLVERGFAPSREKAKALIMAGIVYVDQNKEDKAGASFDPEEVQIEVRGATLPYVSRGGLKLEKALKVFPIDLTGFWHISRHNSYLHLTLQILSDFLPYRRTYVSCNGRTVMILTHRRNFVNPFFI